MISILLSSKYAKSEPRASQINMQSASTIMTLGHCVRTRARVDLESTYDAELSLFIFLKKSTPMNHCFQDYQKQISTTNVTTQTRRAAKLAKGVHNHFRNRSKSQQNPTPPSHPKVIE